MSLSDSLKTKSLLILFSLVLLTLCSTMAQSSSAQPWNNIYGGAGTQDSFNHILNTSDGGYAMVGFTYSPGSNTSDVWLVKADKDGKEQWNRTYGGPQDDVGYSAVQTSDGGYAIAGYTFSYGDMMTTYLIRTDSSGNMLWNKTYGGGLGSSAYSMALTPDGGFIMAGWEFLNDNGWDMYLVRTDADGKMLWDKTYGGQDKDLAHYISPTSDGGFIITGNAKSYGHGNGGGNSLDIGSEDLWLMKTDAQGNESWNHTYGGYGYDDGYAVMEAEDGGYIIAGTTYSFDNNGMPLTQWSGDTVGKGYILHTDAQGNQTWYKLLNGYGNLTLFSMAKAPGGYVFAGAGENSGRSYDYFAAKTDMNGSLVWSNYFGGSKSDYCYSVAPATDGGYSLAGNSNSFTLDGSLRGYVMKLDENGGFSTTLGEATATGNNSLIIPLVILAIIVIVAIAAVIVWKRYNKKTVVKAKIEKASEIEKISEQSRSKYHKKHRK